MSSHKDLDWYKTMPAYPSLDDAFRDFKLQPIPDDWVIYITDVVGSTKAIEAGQYKDVNTAGSLPTMALANLLGSMHFPFIFGGDGMTALLPSTFDPQVRGILGRTRTMVRELLSLDLRVGAVPVAELTKRKAEIYVAKIRVSDRYAQALLWGEGMNLAEEMVKGRDKTAKEAGPSYMNPWLIEEEGTGGDIRKLAESADFKGFSCRWRPIPSHLGKTVSLLVQPRGPEPERILQTILADIRQITGSDELTHPISIEKQEINTNPRVVTLEADVSGYDPQKPGLVDGRFRNFMRKLNIRILLSLARFIVRFRIRGLKYKGQEAALQRTTNRVNSDVRKVDGILKMVIACTPEQVTALDTYLAAKRAAKLVRYGIHVSTQALMTCFVHDGTGNEVHFVDADGGGYALAAKMLKDQIKQD